MRDQIQIAAKMYRCQDTAKRFFGDEYAEKIKPYQQCISGYAKEHDCDELKAVLKICEDEVIRTNGMAVMLLMSAAVDLIEPQK
jgi:hypothetical protein